MSPTVADPAIDKVLADAVRSAATALEAAVVRAASAGLTVNVELIDATSMRQPAGARSYLVATRITREQQL